MADSDMSYGLPDPRDTDDDSSLDGVHHEFEWDGEDVELRLIPPTLDQTQKYRDMGTDVEIEALKRILDRHIVKPEKDPGEMTLREVNCYVDGIFDYNNNSGGKRMQEVREELERRRGGTGNPV